LAEAPEQNDPDVVRREYANEAGLAARFALWARRDGPQPQDVAFEEVLAAAPRRVLDVGAGRGELAERIQQVGIEVVAVDQSERMVELTRARGVEALVGDVQALPFEDAAFDVVVANFMLYHVPDVVGGVRRDARHLTHRVQGSLLLTRPVTVTGRGSKKHVTRRSGARAAVAGPTGASLPPRVRQSP
jgi:2-polyprenyl-3-methyl-5-hydroxy-6-metoxy-1,4-benzoquinol methylase